MLLCKQQGISPLQAKTPDILGYLLSLQYLVLPISFLQVHLLAISLFHFPIDVYSVFSHSVTARVLKGLRLPSGIKTGTILGLEPYFISPH